MDKIAKAHENLDLVTMILKEYSNDKIILRHLSLDDADFFYDIYSHPQLTANFDESPFLPNETPTAFTERIISLCHCIFTIRLSKDSQRVIGDCALHHWNKETNEIIIGGSLYPEYWGKDIMRSAFEILTNIAKEELGVRILLGPTKTRNLKAIRLVEKMGFEKYKVDEYDTLMRKVL
jgi:ribosomal-protein-alanine N-acetyltransferase